MSETPKVGDKVRFTIEAEYIRPSANHDVSDHLVLAGAGDEYTLPYEAAIEILERADDPKNDPVGTIRAELDGSAVYVKTQDRRWSRVSSRSCEGGHSFAENEMGMSKLVGAVPGTPAAVAETAKAAPVEPEYEYYRSHGGRLWRVLNGVAELFCAPYWFVDRSATPAERPDLYTHLDGKPAELQPKPVEITAESPEPDRSKVYRDRQGDRWSYNGGWRFYDADARYRSSTYPWGLVASLFPAVFPWRLADGE